MSFKTEHFNQLIFETVLLGSLKDKFKDSRCQSWLRGHQILVENLPSFLFKINLMNWRPQSISELTIIIFNIELSHLDLKAFN